MSGLTDPVKKTITITPSDTVNIPLRITGFRVGTTAGAVSCTYEDGHTDIIPNVQVGEIIPARPVRINATGTGAAGITGFVQF